MDRYRYTGKEVDKYLTTEYPTITPKSNDIVLTVKYGDRLDLLAVKYYQDKTLWWIIAIANQLRCDSYFIELERDIRIPLNYIEIIKGLRGK